MSGFKVIHHPGPQVVGRARFVVYDLDFDDAHEWHQTACGGDECWCQGLSPQDFVQILYEEVLRPAKYARTPLPPGSIGKDQIRLTSTIPGFNRSDDTHLKQTIGGQPVTPS